MVTPEVINQMLEAEWATARCVCVEVSRTHAVARLTPESGEIRPGGLISGPTLFAAADAALWFLAFGATGTIEPLALTSELSIRFLRPATGEAVTFRLRPLVDAQEMVGHLGGISYWEGACEVLDEQGRVVGEAYVELTGYAAEDLGAALQ